MKMTKLIRHIAMTLLGVFALTTLSCERDTFYVADYVATPGRPVNVKLSFELPLKDEVAMTRTITDKEEHMINDFYLLIFDSQGNRVFGKYYYNEELHDKVTYNGGTWSSVDSNPTNPNDQNSTHGYVMAKAMTGTCYIFGFANIGDSEEENVEPNDLLEGTAVKNRLYKGLTSTRYKLDHIENIDSLYRIQIDAMSEAKANILERTNPNLMYSGAWQKYSDKPYENGFDLVKGSAGEVNIDEIMAITDPTSPSGYKYVDEDGNIDLTEIGMVYLRCLTAHITFNIEINDEVFSAFEPESWQVVNLPTRVYLMDQGNNTPLTRAEIEFKESTVMPHMLHDNGKFTFDFWMYENHKKTRNARGEDLKPTLLQAKKTNSPSYVNPQNAANPEYANQYLDETDMIMSDPYDKDTYKDQGIIDYYDYYFGNTLLQWDDEGDGTGNPLPKLKTIYGYDSWKYDRHQDYGYYKGKTKAQLTDDEKKNINNDAIKQFLYAKREYQIKRRSQNTAVWNRKGDYNPDANTTTIDVNRYSWGTNNDLMRMNYSSKKFVYADDKATYVIIKGRLRFKNTDANGDSKDITLINYGYQKETELDGSEYLKPKEDKYKDGYIDATYTIHLGNFNDDENKGAKGSMDNFDVLRNTEYTYNVKINGINSIYTTVESNLTEGGNPQYRVKKQPGADGLMNLAKGVVYNTDAHFCQFNMMLTKASLSDFYFEMHTPWNNYSSDDFKKNGHFIYVDDTTESTTKMNEDIAAGYYNSKDVARVKSIISDPDFFWFKFSPTMDQTDLTNDASNYDETVYGKSRQTEKYNRSNPNLWNLYDFMLEMEKIVQAAQAVVDAGFDVTTNAGLDDYNAAQEADPVTYPIKLTKFQCKTTRGEGGIPANTPTYLYFLDSRIKRMFYTVYLDEYYYYQMPRGVTNWVRPYWKHFANQPSRYVNFGYRDGSSSGVTSGYMLSPDKQSGTMITQLTVVQPSIQTFYSTETINSSERFEVAIGLEHENETHDPRWTDKYDTPATSGMDRYNGWEFAWTNLKDLGTDSWEKYVDNVVYDDENGMQNNIIMRGSGNDIKPTSTATWQEGGKTVTGIKRNDTTPANRDDDNQYVAGAVRMCMNRNRDENNNGKIDECELKWFLPTSRQLELASLGHYSLQDPLFEFNDLVNGDKHRFHKTGKFAVSNIHGEYLWMYHYVSSDYHTLTSEEMLNSPTYDTPDDYQSRPYEMRCVRNLGGEYDKNGNIIVMSGEYKDKNSGNAIGAPYNYVSKTPQSLLFEYDQVNKIFKMTYYDSRSVRGIYYNAQELADVAPYYHYLFSTTNLPYYRFKVAKNLEKISVPANTKYDYIFKTMRPCSNYSEEPGGGDIGSWRVPNHAELGVMVIQLRQYNYTQGESKVQEQNPAWFFGSNNQSSPHIYSSTSWNFTGPYVRVHNANYNNNEGWGITTSNPTQWGNLDSYNLVNFNASNMYVRCVKDYRGDQNYYKEFVGSDSESYQDKHGAESEGFTED